MSKVRVRRFYPSNTGIKVDDTSTFQLFFKSLIKFTSYALPMSITRYVYTRLNTMAIGASRFESTGIHIAKNLSVLLCHEIRIFRKGILNSICELLHGRNSIFKRNCSILYVWRIDSEKFLCICHGCCTDCDHKEKRSASPPALPRREGAGALVEAN